MKIFEDEINNTPNITLIQGSEEKETMKSFRNFLMAFIVAVLAIYFVLVLLLDSFATPFLIIITEPFLVPMVLAMSWGLMFATVVTLFIVPLLYSISFGTKDVLKSVG